MLAVAGKIACSRCTDLGFWGAATRQQMPPEKIRAIPDWWDSDLFTELERLVLGYAEAMTATPPWCRTNWSPSFASSSARGSWLSSPGSSRCRTCAPASTLRSDRRASGRRRASRAAGKSRGPAVTTSPDSAADVFQYYRDLLFAVAYRMLGTVADAEDAVQDTWIRWSSAPRDDVTEPKAYLVRIVTNTALDRLRLAKARRESYVGPWLPEPMLTGPMSRTGRSSPSRCRWPCWSSWSR